MSEKEIETVVLDEALVQEIIKDQEQDRDDARDRAAGGRIIRLDPALKKPAAPKDEAGN